MNPTIPFLKSGLSYWVSRLDRNPQSRKVEREIRMWYGWYMEEMVDQKRKEAE